MLRAYLNYPNSRMSVHADPACGHIQQAHKAGQRVVRLGPGSIGVELPRFAGGEYQFAAQAAMNDMWLFLDFSDPEFELALVRHIRRLLGTRYKRFRERTIERHCPCP